MSLGPWLKAARCCRKHWTLKNMCWLKDLACRFCATLSASDDKRCFLRDFCRFFQVGLDVPPWCALEPVKKLAASESSRLCFVPWCIQWRCICAQARVDTVSPTQTDRTSVSFACPEPANLRQAAYFQACAFLNASSCSDGDEGQDQGREAGEEDATPLLLLRELRGLTSQSARQRILAQIRALKSSTGQLTGSASLDSTLRSSSASEDGDVVHSTRHSRAISATPQGQGKQIVASIKRSPAQSGSSKLNGKDSSDKYAHDLMFTSEQQGRDKDSTAGSAKASPQIARHNYFVRYVHRFFYLP